MSFVEEVVVYVVSFTRGGWWVILREEDSPMVQKRKVVTFN